MTGAGKERLAALRGRFADRLARDADRIGQLIGPASRGDAAARKSIHEIAHRMAGASGSFGFGEVGLRAAELEEAVSRGGARVRSAADDLIATLEDLRDAT